LRRRARLQRVEEAVRRNVVVGFFDTLYWARRFRRTLDQKKHSRMVTIPTFSVPEIFIDDEDVTNAERGQQSAVGSPLFSPTDLHGTDRYSNSSGGFSLPRLDTSVRSRSNSIQMTPQASPTRGMTLSTSSPRTSAFPPPGDADWQFASALSLSRPASPHAAEAGSADARSRANSAVSAADVLEVLDNSAWGESIRRSFTQRRRS
jgi:hypothetical protein